MCLACSAGLFIRVYDSRRQEGTTACLDVLGMMIKPFISQILDNTVPKGCHLLNGVYVKPVTLAVLSLVHVCFTAELMRFCCRH